MDFSPTVAESFEMEKLKRCVENAGDMNELKSLTKDLIEAWFKQKAATRSIIGQRMTQETAMMGFQ